MARKPRLVYGRMTGWGQEGPLAHAAGHDINYHLVTGALARSAQGKACAATQLVGDFAAARFISWPGVLAAMLEASKSARARWSMPRCAMVRLR